jgi:DNA-binding NtrC family response regulator
VARILVVEDEELVRRMLQAALKQRGHRVDVCVDGEQAFGRLQVSEYDVLITDYRMPRMTGLQLIHALDFSIPTILMSSNTPEELALTDKDLEGLEFLRKPFGLTDLYAAVNRATKSKR